MNYLSLSSTPKVIGFLHCRNQKFALLGYQTAHAPRTYGCWFQSENKWSS